MSIYVDISAKSINKYGEELCGDKYEYYRNKNGIIAVLSDGLGSGVKANILATLTSKIAITMLREGIDIHEVVDTIANTLPVCSVRKLAYSTFSIVKIDNEGNGYLAEFDTPFTFFFRNGEIINNNYETVEINNRIIRECRFNVKTGDTIVMVSDGVIHAGAGKTMNLGWKWENVADFLKEIENSGNVKMITKTLVGACNDLYLDMPGDDTTALTLKIETPSFGVMFSGPPEQKENDKEVIKELFNNYDKKIVCGGTAANIVARETGREIETNFKIYDYRVPPYAKIDGIDLVTEGVLTMKVTIDKLKMIAEGMEIELENENDGASKLAKILSEDCSHIKMLVGKAINPAHQNPYFPQELSIKLNVLNELKNVLEKIGKVVNVEYY